ncbi:hypothetical protein D3C81_1819780 [compost metagenome]
MRDHFGVAVIDMEMDVQRGAVGFVNREQECDGVFVVVTFVAGHQHGRFVILFRCNQPFITGCIQRWRRFSQGSEINKRIGITAELVDTAHHHHQRDTVFANQIGIGR